MYSVSKKKRRKKFFLKSEDVIALDGFMMGSKNKTFNIRFYFFIKMI